MRSGLMALVWRRHSRGFNASLKYLAILRCRAWSVVAFDVRTLLRVFGLDVAQFDAGMLGSLLYTLLMYAGLLSQRIAPGFPRHSMVRSSERITRAAGSDRLASMPRPSR